MSETTAIATQKPAPMLTGERGLVLRNLDDMFRFANGVVKSGLAPSSFKTPEAVMIAIQYGAEVGLSPMQSLQSLAVINGKPSLYGDALPALAWGSGLLEGLQETIEGDGDTRTARCLLVRKGASIPIIRTFSVADAKKASLWGKSGPWSSYPDRMLAMRARAFAFRDGFADVLRGLHVSEEVADYQPMSRVESVDQSVGYTLPTGEPAKIESKPVPVIDVESEGVQAWRVTIGFADTQSKIDKLYHEFQESPGDLNEHELAAVQELFDNAVKKLQIPY